MSFKLPDSPREMQLLDGVSELTVEFTSCVKKSISFDSFVFHDHGSSPHLRTSLKEHASKASALSFSGNLVYRISYSFARCLFTLHRRYHRQTTDVNNVQASRNSRGRWRTLNPISDMGTKLSSIKPPGSLAWRYLGKSISKKVLEGD